ncbi:hypothetical protein RND81_07G063300 [Saponaria officinalis]|uniref:Nuclear transcription factor Y subunit n=1 Tax=Saponaria officinalis TaxID=3572 RepID=A0AAW1JKU9_SAPOF
MSEMYSNHRQWWNSNEQQMSESLSKNLSLKMDSPPNLGLNAMPLSFQLHEQDSSSSQSTQSNHDLTATAAAATARVDSQDQCMSSESGQEVNGGYNLSRMKPVYMMGYPDTACNTTHFDYSRTMTCMPHPCNDPYFNGLLSAYGSPPVIQTQIMGITSARLPLPVDISEDEPIYVNAKQYHGILRRRQSRAKLEAQNKLIKARKPYLHESRHRHALNRVRGTGGRFLSTKKAQESDSNLGHDTHSNSNSYSFGHNNNNVSTIRYESHHQTQCIETGNAFYQQTDGGFLGISSGGSRQGNGSGFMNNPTQHRAPVVR